MGAYKYLTRYLPILKNLWSVAKRSLPLVKAEYNCYFLASVFGFMSIFNADFKFHTRNAVQYVYKLSDGNAEEEIWEQVAKSSQVARCLRNLSLSTLETGNKNKDLQSGKIMASRNNGEH